MLRLLLPPNLPAAATRDAIAVRIELDLAKPPSEELIPVLIVLQRLCGAPKPPPFIQLKRSQLLELVQAAKGKPVFVWAHEPGTPILWIGSHLRGVSDHLRDVTPSAPNLPTSTPAATSLPPVTRQIEVPRSRGVPLAAGSSIRPRIQAVGTSRPARDEEYSPMKVDGSEHFLSIQLPSREHITYAACLEWVKGSGFTLDPSNRRWWLRDRHKVLNLLANERGRIEREFRAEFSDNFGRNTAHLRYADIACEAEETSEGYSITLGLSAGNVSEDKLLQAAASGRGYVESGKEIFLLPPEKLATLAKAQRSLAGSPGAPVVPRRTHRVQFARLNEVEDVLAEAAPHFQPPSRWRERSEALRNLTSLPPAPLPEAFTAHLRPYQRLGTAWLWHLHRHGLGGILADEMGLGKTVQAIGLLLAVHSQARKRPPSLVVCPASLVENWLRELRRFAPELTVGRHHGNERWSPSGPSAPQVVITSYGMLARDRESFADSDFACLICDEAQHAKNRRTLNAQSLRSLHAEGRVMLTGTPVENSIEDLRSLFDILMPGLVEALPPGLRGDDRAWFDERLRAKTAPYVLRRTKKQVAPELPPRIEQVLYCEMSASQARLYREVQESSERALLDLEASGASEGALRMATLTQLLRLRQVCCDPRLLPEGTAKAGADSAKLDLFRELIEEAIDDGHRILVFSQFTSLLALLKEELEKMEIAHCYLDGSMSTAARQTQVDAFQNRGDIPLFLISLKAGGTGLNLTAADTVIHMDPWWNPAVEAQATDRAHRIGQTRAVTSYKLICSGSVEEKVLLLQETKRALLADVFEASDALSSKLSLGDLKALVSP